MISRPTSVQLITAIQRELRDVVVPALTDPAALGTLEMADALLASLAVRAAHEVAWMREEIAAAEVVARRLLDAGLDQSGSVGAALADLDGASIDAGHLDEVISAYDLAGELLSRCLEAAMPAGGEPATAASAALELRLAHETQIRGDFSLAGRT